MIEFSPEWIEEQKELVSKLPRYSKDEYIDINGKQLIAVGDIDPEVNSANVAPLLSLEYEEDVVPVKECILNYYEALDHIEHLQKRIAELESVNEDQALTISQNDYAYTIDREIIKTKIKESNDLLRSAFMIAKRDGKETNWEAWRKQLEIALTRQHKMMYGKD